MHRYSFVALIALGCSGSDKDTADDIGSETDTDTDTDVDTDADADADADSDADADPNCAGRIQGSVSLDASVDCSVPESCTGTLHVSLYAQPPGPMTPPVVSGSLPDIDLGAGPQNYALPEIPCGSGFIAAFLDVDGSGEIPPFPSPGDLSMAPTMGQVNNGVNNALLVLDIRVPEGGTGQTGLGGTGQTGLGGTGHTGLGGSGHTGHTGHTGLGGSGHTGLGGSGDTAAGVPADAIVKGTLVITEIMPNPVAVADPLGEWFEVVNTSGIPVDIEGLVIRDDGGDTFTVTGTPLLPAGAAIVFGNNADLATNGGVNVDYVFANMTLDNGPDEIVLENAVEVLDRVAVGVGWPNPLGASLNLQPILFDEAANDNAAAWCLAIDPYGAGDLGTPGAANHPCAIVGTGDTGP